MRKNMLIICPSITDATSYYRAVQPLCEFRNEYSLTFKDGRDINQGWPLFYQYDIVYWLRPSDERALNGLITAKNANCKIWIDFDDLLWNVPSFNPAYNDFKGRRPYIKACCELADIVSVSTTVLSKYFLSDLDIPTMVLPNSWDFARFSPVQAPAANDLIVWRGGKSHQGDTLAQLSDITAFLDKLPTFKLALLGEPHWTTVDPLKAAYGDRITLVTPLALDDYFVMLKKVAPKYVIVPLADLPFNATKSNIAWQEATYAGAITLCDFWTDVPSLPLRGAEPPSEADRATLWADARVALEQQFNLKITTTKRRRLLEQL